MSMQSVVPPRVLPFATDILVGLLLVYCVWQLIAVDIVVWTTNDSSAYLAHSSDFSQLGLVVGGYRTAGYPLFLRAMRELSALVTLDPLFGAVLVQRLLLGVALAASVLTLRLWSLPIIIFAANPMMMSFTNLIGPEPLMLSLMLILSLGCIALYRRAVVPVPFSFLFAYAGLCLLFLYVCTLKISMAPFGLLLAAVLWRASVDAASRHGRPTAFMLLAPGVRALMVELVVISVALAAFLGMVALENRSEWSVTSPAANTERSRYWGVYMLVFSDGANRAKPELAEYFDGGSPYPFLHRMECAGAFNAASCVPVPYPERRAQIEKRIGAMLSAAELGTAQLQITGMAAAFWGGRLDDLGSSIRKVMYRLRPLGDPSSVELIDNLAIRQNGVESFLAAYNDGKTPAKFDGVARPAWLGYHPRVVQPWLVSLVLGVLVLSINVGTGRVLGLAGLVSFAIFGAVIGLAYLDNWRYIAPAWVTIIAISLGSISDSLWQRRLQPLKSS